MAGSFSLLADVEMASVVTVVAFLEDITVVASLEDIRVDTPLMVTLVTLEVVEAALEQRGLFPRNKRHAPVAGIFPRMLSAGWRDGKIGLLLLSRNVSCVELRLRQLSWRTVVPICMPVPMTNSVRFVTRSAPGSRLLTINERMNIGAPGRRLLAARRPATPTWSR